MERRTVSHVAEESLVAAEHTAILAVTRRLSWQAQRTIAAPTTGGSDRVAEDQDVQEAEAMADDDVDEILVEEISIDGMCGVY